MGQPHPIHLSLSLRQSPPLNFVAAEQLLPSLRCPPGVYVCVCCVCVCVCVCMCVCVCVVWCVCVCVYSQKSSMQLCSITNTLGQ